MPETFSGFAAATIIGSDSLKHSDAIVLLEGDYYNRVSTASRLFQEGWGKYVVVSGGVYNAKVGSVHGKYLRTRLLKEGIPFKKIILEDFSQNTREQAVEIMKLAKKRRWKKIILVASPYHQLRAFLTFLKAMQEFKLSLAIYNAPARNLSWFKKDSKESRFKLLNGELEKIYKYKDHVASFEDAIRYLERREKKFNNKF